MVWLVVRLAVWLLVATRPDKALTEGSRVAESLESKMIKRQPHIHQSRDNALIFMIPFRCRDSNRQTYGNGYGNSDNADQCYQNPRSKSKNSIFACPTSVKVCYFLFAKWRVVVVVDLGVVSGDFRVSMFPTYFGILVPSRNFGIGPVI